MGTSGACLDKSKQSAMGGIRDTVDILISTLLQI